MTKAEFGLIWCLSGCSFLSGSFEKRFVRDMVTKSLDYELSEKQLVYLMYLRHRYRKQLSARGYVDGLVTWEAKRKIREMESELK